MKRMNLLPKAKQKDLEYESWFHSIAVAASFGIALLLLGVAAQVASGIYIKKQINVVANQIEQMKRNANKTENAAVKAKIKTANAQIEDFYKMSQASPIWSKVLIAFTEDVPSGMNITSFTADADKKEVTIAGFSPSRDLVIDLYNNINADKAHFSDINYPLENVAQPVNVNFTFTFHIVDSVLKP